MFVDDAVFPVVTEIMNHLRNLPDTRPMRSEQETRSACLKAMENCEIFEPLNIEQSTIWVLLLHKRADYQTCHAIWAYFIELSKQFEEEIEPEWEVWPIAA